MRQLALAVSRREGTGKSAARKLRQRGFVPAVIYGTRPQAEHLAVAVNDLQKVLAQVSGSVAFLSLQVEGEDAPRMAMLQEVQLDQIGRRYLHVDFLEIHPEKELTVEVPLELVGEAAGVKAGGMLNQLAYTLIVRGLVADIPDTIAVDVSGLEVGDTLTASQVPLPEKVAAAWEEDFPVATCLKPMAAEVAEEEGEEAEGEAGEEAAAEEAAADKAEEPSE
jgi:large subunit ribosomal protein L25